jgi:cell division protein FtsZ
MTLNLIPETQTHADFTPRITVIGVGGGGTNAVNNMIDAGLTGVEFVVANTDAQQLNHSRASKRVQLGPHITKGLGAGAKPDIGRAAANEAEEELGRHLDGCHMVFITAGMGGGTGTGAAPVIARMARERNILTVGVVTKPFTFEGARRMKAAEAGIIDLQQHVDTLIVIPNQNLFATANERTTFREAFHLADQVLYMGVRGVTDLMTGHGLINLDFADIHTVMAGQGKAMMGTGEADGEDRARRAAELAISNKLLEDTSMAGAKGLLINVTGGDDMTLFEVDQAVNRIHEEIDHDPEVLFGSAIDPNLTGRIRVSVVATGIDSQTRNQQRPEFSVVGGDPGIVPPPVIPVVVEPVHAEGSTLMRDGNTLRTGPRDPGDRYPHGRVGYPQDPGPTLRTRDAMPADPTSPVTGLFPDVPSGVRPQPVVPGTGGASQLSAPAQAGTRTGERRSMFRLMTGAFDGLRGRATPNRPVATFEEERPAHSPINRQDRPRNSDETTDVPSFLSGDRNRRSS